jgi:acetyltransferase
VNPKRTHVLGIQAYPRVSAIPESPDLVVIAVPAPAVLSVIQDCVAVGVKAAIILSAGFKEIGAAGIELEQAILAEARRGRMRIVGPNCLGVDVSTHRAERDLCQYDGPPWQCRLHQSKWGPSAPPSWTGV